MIRVGGLQCLSRGWIVWISILWVGLMGGCSLGKSGVDETSNGLLAQVLNTEQKPLVGAQVRLRPAQWISNGEVAQNDSSLGIWNVTTDPQGFFEVESLPQGHFVMEVLADSLGALLLIDSVWPSTVEVQSLGLLKGSVVFPQGVSSLRLVIPGLEHIFYTASDGSFSMPNLPSSKLEVLALLPDTDVVVASQKVELLPGESDSILLEPIRTVQDSLPHRLVVSVDTRPGAANVQQRVDDFPLLVELSGDFFPTEAAAEGADLRVVDMRGEAFPFEITWWDSVAKVAQLWILIDTVHSNDSNSVAKILWGASSSAWSLSSSQDVFDTSLGFTGVWHLQSLELSDGLWGSPDATVNQYHALSPAQGVSIPDMGLEGATFQTQGQQGLWLENLSTDLGMDSYTVEMRVKFAKESAVLLARNDEKSELSAGEKFFYLGSPGRSFSESLGFYPTYVAKNDLEEPNVAGDSPLPLNQWHHLAVVHERLKQDTSKVRWYVDGVAVDAWGDSLLVESSDDNADRIYVGFNWGQGGFEGVMRELRVYHRVCTKAWMKLSAEMQKPHSSLVLLSRE